MKRNLIPKALIGNPQLWFPARSLPSGSGYTGEFLANDPSRLRANAIEHFELIRNRLKPGNGCDTFVPQAVLDGERETETSDRTSPPLVVVRRH
jgi:hypothetical protein